MGEKTLLTAIIAPILFKIPVKFAGIFPYLDYPTSLSTGRDDNGLLKIYKITAG